MLIENRDMGGNIYISKDEVLFAYFEYSGNDYEKDMALIAACPHTQEWWKLVKPLMQPIDSRGLDEFWADMTEIYHLD